MSFALSKSVNPAMVFIERKTNVTGRWDPHFHSPRFANLDSELDAIGAKPIYKFSQNIFSGITPLSGGDAYTSDADGVAFIRSGDFNEDGTINKEALIFLKPGIHQKLMRRSQLREHDVLFAIVGATIGKVGIFPGGYDANINQAVCAVRLNKEVIPHFLHAFFLTRLGQEQIERVKRPVARANINLEEVGTLRLRVLDRAIQVNVVDALKRAFAQKASTEKEAAQLLSSVDDLLLDELGIPSEPEPPNTLESRLFSRKFSDVTGSRFDPFFNSAAFTTHDNLLRQHRDFVRLRSIGCLIRGVIYSSTDERDEGHTVLRANNIDLGTGDLVLDDLVHISNDVQFDPSQRLRRGDILICAASGSKEHAGKATYISNDINAYFGGFMMVLRCQEDNVLPEYLAYYMQSGLFRRSIFRHLGGTNINNLSIAMVQGLGVVVPEKNRQKRILETIRGVKDKARTLREQARADLEKAKRDIEALILGRDVTA